MKKFVSLLCMLTCVFALTACGSQEEATEFEQLKMDNAIIMATEYIIPSFDSFRTEEAAADLAKYTAEEIEFVMGQSAGISVEGSAYLGAIGSFNAAYDSIGERVSLGQANAAIDDDQIIVHVEVQGESGTAEAEVILSNDMFLTLEAAALNPSATMKDLMVNAALNTLIGMGTVFAVLILICLIISCFGIIPKIQARKAGKKEEKKAVVVSTEKAVTQVVTQEQAIPAADYELIAVIAAAIAASEGAASTDGFVVRSIRRRTAR